MIEHGLFLHQHNIGYTADGFYRSDDPTNSVKSTEGGWLVGLERYQKYTRYPIPNSIAFADADTDI